MPLAVDVAKKEGTERILARQRWSTVPVSFGQTAEGFFSFQIPLLENPQRQHTQLRDSKAACISTIVVESFFFLLLLSSCLEFMIVQQLLSLDVLSKFPGEHPGDTPPCSVGKNLLPQTFLILLL